MSVYTPVAEHELKPFLARYSVGELVDAQGILAGIENTNYFITTSRERLVLTLFEALDGQALAYCLDLMGFLAERGLPCPRPVPDTSGRYLQTLKGRPAVLVTRLPGCGVNRPCTAQCHALGAALGRLHRLGEGFPGTRPNPRSSPWWGPTLETLSPLLTEQDLLLARNEIGFQSARRWTHLPHGTIHADLFRDNALFVGKELSGIVDLYGACNGILLYDVAIAVNDWCCLPDGSLDEPVARALLAGYQEERPFVEAEEEAWPVMLRAAALRFWLSRLYHQHFPRVGAITHIKDSTVFRDILCHHIEHRPGLIARDRTTQSYAVL